MVVFRPYTSRCSEQVIPPVRSEPWVARSSALSIVGVIQILRHSPRCTIVIKPISTLLQTPAKRPVHCLTMTMSTSASPTNGIHEDTRSSQSDSKVNKIWKAGRSIEIPAGPAANILDFAFANLSEYDASKPVRWARAPESLLLTT